MKYPYTQCVAHRVALSIALIFGISSALSAQTIINVSPGSDLIAVRDQVRTLNSNMTDEIIVYLQDGEYELSQTLEFTAADSATNGHRIIWANSDNARPRISGGRYITGWQDEPDGTISAAVPNNAKFRQIYVNGVKAKRARFQDSPFTFIRVSYEPANNRFVMTQAEATAKGVSTSWTAEDLIELNVVATFNSHQVRLKSITGDGTNVYLNIEDTEASYLEANVPHFADYDYDIFLENAREFIDEEGEWYMDETANRVYYKPRAGETAANVSVKRPQLLKLVDIDGANDLVFYGLVFEHSIWVKPGNSGRVGIQSMYFTTTSTSWVYNTEIPAAIQIRNSDRVQFERNIIRFTGGSGMMAFDDETKYLALIGNVFYETAAAALQLGDDDKKGAIAPGLGLFRPVVRNNYFYKIGFECNSPVVFGTFPYKLDFTNNELEESPAMGLNLGWGGLNSNDLLHRPFVKANKFKSIAQEGTDTSVYHTRNQTYGSRVVENWFDNTVKVVNGRVLGRFSVSYNDPKFGNMYLDNDAIDNNFVRNVHTGFNLNGWASTQGGAYIYGEASAPNYIISAEASEETDIKSRAGLLSEYSDIKTYMHSGSIGGTGWPVVIPLSTMVVDDSDSDVTYTGQWVPLQNGTDRDNGNYLGGHHVTNASGASVSLSFTGTGVEVFSIINASSANVDIYIDGTLIESKSLASTPMVYQRVWFSKKDLSPGSHTLEIIRTGGGTLRIDGFDVYRDQRN